MYVKYSEYSDKKRYEVGRKGRKRALCGDVEGMVFRKKRCGYMKRAGKNAQLPCGLALNQKIETRFGAVCDIVEKFIKSAPNVYEHRDENT